MTKFYLGTTGWPEVKAETIGEVVGTGILPRLFLFCSQQMGIASDRLQNHLVVKEHPASGTDFNQSG